MVTFAHPSASYLFFGHQPLVLPGPLTVVVSHGRLGIRIVLLTILFVNNTVVTLWEGYHGQHFSSSWIKVFFAFSYSRFQHSMYFVQEPAPSQRGRISPFGLSAHPVFLPGTMEPGDLGYASTNTTTEIVVQFSMFAFCLESLCKSEYIISSNFKNGSPDWGARKSRHYGLRLSGTVRSAQCGL